MKIVYSLLSIFLLFSCSSTNENIIDNQKIIKKIDSIKDFKITYELEVDSVGRTLDTLSKQLYKENTNQTKVYKEYELFNGNGVSKFKKYYRENGNLFYSTLESSEYGILSKEEFWENDKAEIQNGISVEYDNAIALDTVYVSYKHFYNAKGLKEKTVVETTYKGELSNNTVLLYDKNNLKQEIVISKSDTLSISKYEYINNKLSKKTKVNNQNNSTSILKYNSQGFPKEEEIYVIKNDSLNKVRHTIISTNDKGEVNKTVQTNYPSMEKKYIVYIDK